MFLRHWFWQTGYCKTQSAFFLLPASSISFLLSYSFAEVFYIEPHCGVNCSVVLINFWSRYLLQALQYHIGHLFHDIRDNLHITVAQLLAYNQRNDWQE